MLCWRDPKISKSQNHFHRSNYVIPATLGLTMHSTAKFKLSHIYMSQNQAFASKKMVKAGMYLKGIFNTALTRTLKMFKCYSINSLK